MLQGSMLSGASLVAVMIAAFLALYFLLLKWWRPANRAQQSVRSGLWSVVVLTPFSIGPALGMDPERAIKGVTVLIVVFFIFGAAAGVVYSISPLYRRRENNNA